MIGLIDVAEDGGLQLSDRSEHPTLEALPSELGEEALDRVEPGCRCRGEVKGPARMPSKPFAHFGMFVGGIIIDDGMDQLSFGNLVIRSSMTRRGVPMAPAISPARPPSASRSRARSGTHAARPIGLLHLLALKPRQRSRTVSQGYSGGDQR
jgi:hypothetical protein